MSSASPDRRREWLLYGLAFGCFFQQAVLFPVLPPFATDLGFSVGTVGVILGVRFLLPALIASQLGAWTVRFGLRRSMIVAGVGMVGAAALYAMADDLVTLILAQVVNGLLYLLAWISAQTYATRMPNRDFVLGIFATTTAVGMAIAPVLGGLALDLGGYGWAFGLYGLGALALALNAWALGSAPMGRPAAPTRSARGRTRALLRRPGLQAAFLFSFLCLFTISLRGNVVPLYLDELGYSASAVGAILGAGSLGQAAIRPFTHVLVRHFALTSTMMVAVVLAIVGIALMPLLPVLVGLLTLAFVHGSGAGLHQSLGLVLLAADTDDEERGQAVGLRASVNQVSVAIAPVIAGGVAALIGLGPMLIVLCGALALGLVLLYRVLATTDVAASPPDGPSPRNART